MPELSGFQFCREIRKTRSLDSLPIIVITSDSQDIVSGLHAGANDFLPKPVTCQELRMRLETHLELVTFKVKSESLLSSVKNMAKTLDSSESIMTFLNYVLSSMVFAKKFSVKIWQRSLNNLRVDYTVLQCIQIPDLGINIKQSETWLKKVKMSQSVSNLNLDELIDKLYQREYSYPIIIHGEKNLPHLVIEITSKNFTQYKHKIDLDYIKSLSNNLKIILSMHRAFEQLIHLELAEKKARLEELGKVAVKLGDKLNNPIEVMALCIEELADIANDSLSPNDAYEIEQLTVKMMNALTKASEEIKLLHQFKEYAPEDALSLNFGEGFRD